MSFVKLLEDTAGMMSTNTHLKGVLGFRGVFDLTFLFIVKILHNVQNGSGYTLSSMSFQTFELCPANSDHVDICPILWYNNPKETSFLGICFCDYDFSFIFTKNEFFSVSCAVISLHSIGYHWRKPCKNLYEKSGMYQIH